MTTVLDVLEEISKLEDPIEQSNAIIALYEELESGPWREVHEQAAALAESEAVTDDRDFKYRNYANAKAFVAAE